MPRQADITTVAFVLVPWFPLHALALCIDSLRIANRDALDTVFQWLVVSEDGEPVESSCGISVPVDLAIDEAGRVPVAIVVAGYEPGHRAIPKTLHWLRRLNRARAWIGCVDTGAVILGQAGLLGQQPTCVHPEALPGLLEDFRGSQLSGLPYQFGNRRLSSAGGTACVGMMLALIEHCRDAKLANRVALAFNHVWPGRPSEGGVSTMTTPPVRAAAHPVHPVLARCVERMRTTVEEPLTLTELARDAGTTPWTLRRLFERHLDSTPRAYYRRLRLEHARQLLFYSHLRIAEVAFASGFADPATFSRAFRQAFGRSPSRYRREDMGRPFREARSALDGLPDAGV